MSNCKSVQKHDDDVMDEVKSILAPADGGEFECIENSSGTFILCSNRLKVDPLTPNQLLKFLVLNKKSNKITYRNSITGGYVNWIDNERIEFYSQPGIIPDGKNQNDYIKVYNVVTEENLTKSVFLSGKNK
ncbi:MAG TPA: hypothetical protein PKL31_17815 [Fulvivirga sp.]|nr:hypothetical protein [Fulvivirga sp.]